MFHPQRTSPSDSKNLKSLLGSMDSLVFRLRMTEDARQRLPDIEALSPLIAAEQELRARFGDHLRGVRDTIHGDAAAVGWPDIGESIENYQRQLQALRESPAIAKIDHETTSHLLVLAEYYRGLAFALEECVNNAGTTDWRKLCNSYI
jgi:hypothetical protein